MGCLRIRQNQNYQIYDANQIIVVLCNGHVALGEITDAVIYYLYESDEQPVNYSSL
jgi:hypothetical protein